MDIRAENIAVNYLWFTVYNEQNLDLEQTIDEDEIPGEGALLQMWCLFDYEILPNNIWRVYFDVGMRLPTVASLMTRSQYSLSGENVSWDRVFVIDKLKPMIALSVENAIAGFAELCTEAKVKLPHELKQTPTASPEMVQMFCTELEKYYITRRKPMDEINTMAQYEIAMRCPQANSISLTLNATFLILDEVLFNNHAFGHKHNQKEFFKQVPETIFYTIKLRCLEITRNEVLLSHLHIQLFLECVNCSLQMLLGDKADHLLPILEKHGINTEVQKLYFKSATELFNACQNISTPNKELDWNRLLR